MNFKKILQSPFGLALANIPLSYPGSFLVRLAQRCTKNLPKINIQLPLLAILSTIAYTRYYHPHRMTHRYILKSLIFMQLISMLIYSIFLVFSSTYRAEFMHTLNLFSTHTKDSLLTVPISFIIQLIVWYCVILMSNRLAICWFLKSQKPTP